MAGSNRGEDFVSQEEEANSLGKKYGGLVPKKKPLISKDNERAFFDSADWALGKRTPHQQLPPRRPTCTSGRETLE
ncbi:uncharacterized protein LOC131231208 isoform X4 [Magnolia sinica]|uniref:uncharacterized protein LOC131231208 isoform X4 n=1 Tax=Magnolia sinica TaxID=86752 RepID=UPI00265A22DF|nr:uncharacterized protein LOC131231208 isoform X4 [Magnolia sinica]